MIKVLIVDDDPLLLHMYQIKLVQVGYQVFIAENGAVGWEMIREYRPDIVISDFYMPIVSGLEMLQHIRSSKSFEHLPVIILSNTATDQDKKAAQQLGISAFLAKADLTPSQVVTMIEKVLAV